jgi:hypothetical protein
MIIFDLACKQNHPFEGWFQSQANYDTQLASGLISCPHCGSTDIRRMPSAVHLAKPANTPISSANGLPAISAPSGMLAAYQQLLSVIVSNSEDVGKNFAEEARKIHYLEAPLRSIRGEASAEDYEALREEGIEVLRLSVPKKEDLN